ncbi:MAG: dihydropteroate synthase [Candidatus Muiribacteriota bacterium]
MNFFNASNNTNLLKSLFKENQVSPEGRLILSQKLKSYVVELKSISLAKALVLKQDMLVCGGDAALPADAVRGSIKKADVYLTGTERNFEKLISKIQKQRFLFKELKLIENYLKSIAHKTLFKVRDYTFINNQTYFMGIINTTPDSFSDGGENYNVSRALKNAEEMIENNVSIIDIGGESSRPGAASVSVEEELKRVIPIIKQIRKISPIPISIDTCKPEVADRAFEAGADIINCISGVNLPDKMIDLVKRWKCPFVLMHMRGNPENMQQKTDYNNIVSDILTEIENSYNQLHEVLNDSKKIIIDPGIGFGKTVKQNWEIISRINSFRKLGSPLLVGGSRKSFLKKTFNLENNYQKDMYTLLLSQKMYFEGVNFLRVHNMKLHSDWFFKGDF